VTERDLGTYQMLWDCPYCSTPGLLGLDHRHCPGCGAAQDEDKRYFPNDDQKVAVQDHVFVGADKDCPACSSPMSAKADFCTNCGSPMDAAAVVGKVSDEPEPEPDSGGGGGGGGKGMALGAGCVVMLVLLVVVIGLFLFWKKPVDVQATTHAWERTVEVEVFGPVAQSTWCDSMPSDAYSVSRTSEVRDHRQVPDGETCTTKRRDNGDGTFTEYQDCKPKYRSEPIYDDKCGFKVDRWKTDRTARAAGGLAQAPAWPDPGLVKPGTCKGCDREGKRAETYTVTFETADGKTFDCPFPAGQWKGIAVGSAWSTKQGVMSGTPSCGDLVAK